MNTGSGTGQYSVDRRGRGASTGATKRDSVPRGDRLLDGGTLGLDLLPHLSGISHLLILDAIQSGQLRASLDSLVASNVKQLEAWASTVTPL